jgi:hypothetical protein
MKTIDTSIVIDAPCHIVWSHLIDFDQYPAWNSFIISINGAANEGATLEVTIRPPGGKQMKFSPTCTKLVTGKHLQWKGKVFMNGLFDGEHFFMLQPINDEQTLFIQKENFSGVLVALLWKSMHQKTRVGFEMMNQQLKDRSESSAWRKIN